MQPSIFVTTWRFRENPGAVTPEAMAEYIRCYCYTGTIHTTCEDYRAAAGIDLEHDKTDDEAGRKIQAPLLALWSPSAGGAA